VTAVRQVQGNMEGRVMSGCTERAGVWRFVWSMSLAEAENQEVPLQQ
jgi:hypothetical protein